MALFNSLMSTKISLLFKINSLFRILGNFRKKHLAATAVFELAEPQSDPKSKKFPVFSL
jgi:hypothetical protein